MLVAARRSLVAICLVSSTALAVACSDDDGSSGAGGSSSGGSSSGGTVSEADCNSRCEKRADECAIGANASQLCAQLCDGSVSTAALTCIEALPCSAEADAIQGCLEDNPSGGSSGSSGSPGGSSGSAFGESCRCSGTTGEWECAGTNICSPGLFCVGTGAGPGRCVGPRCCSGEAECESVLGKQGSCASGQKCTCARGELECVGDVCTCAGGVKATRGLCYPG